MKIEIRNGHLLITLLTFELKEENQMWLNFIYTYYTDNV